MIEQRDGSETFHRGWHSRGYLPHLDVAELVQAVTFRLGDSLPRGVIEAVRQNLLSEAERRAKIAALLDAGYGSCLLREPWAARIMEEELLRHHGERYLLFAWVVMPNHVHVIVQARPGFPLGSVVRSWKSFSARRINQVRQVGGALWYPDYFDRYIRNQDHFDRTVEYVHLNPVRAGLVVRPEDWPFSDAARRAKETSKP